MANRSILTFPDARLKEKSKPVTEFGDELHNLVKDMVDTLDVQMGVGLAAPQIGSLARVVVVKGEPFGYIHPFSDELSSGALVLVNPELELSTEKDVWEESCLSVPGYMGKVKRSTRVTLRYQALDGAQKTLNAARPFSAVLQHECDHLDGILYIDHDVNLKRKIYRDIREAHMRKVKETRRAKKEAKRERLAEFDPRKSHGPGKRQKKKGKKR
jgi:peptide deformylase